jgi:predicted O-methyltransferase YrrM
MKFTGNSSDIFMELSRQCPNSMIALDKANKVEGTKKGRILPYQALALYILTKPYNGKPILEIGTLIGFSAAIMAQASPNSQIVTLNPAMHEYEIAFNNLKEYPNVTIKTFLSWNFIEMYEGNFDLIFVDGDHNRIAKDLPWWDKLNPGGLMLFHDYSPLTSYKVYEAVNNFVANLGRELDVLLMDENKIGMAGIYKNE